MKIASASCEKSIFYCLPDTMDFETCELSEWLGLKNLEGYTSLLEQNGYTSVMDIAQVNNEELLSILRLLKKPGHRLKLRLLIQDLQVALGIQQQKMSVVTNEPVKNLKYSSDDNDYEENSKPAVSSKPKEKSHLINQDDSSLKKQKPVIGVKPQNFPIAPASTKPNVIIMQGDAQFIPKPKGFEQSRRISTPPKMEPESDSDKEDKWEENELIDEQEDEIVNAEDDVVNSKLTHSQESELEKKASSDNVDLDSTIVVPLKKPVAPKIKPNSPPAVERSKDSIYNDADSDKTPVVNLNSKPIPPSSAPTANKIKELQEKLKAEQDAAIIAKKPVIAPKKIQNLDGKSPSGGATPQQSSSANVSDDEDERVEQRQQGNYNLEELSKKIPLNPMMKQNLKPKPQPRQEEVSEDKSPLPELLACDDEDKNALQKISILSLNSIVKQGNIAMTWTKNESNFAAKKSYTFALEEHVLYWFKSQDSNAAGKLSLGRYQLSIDNPEETAILTISAGTDVFLFNFDSENERDDWCKIIKKAKIMYKGTPIANPAFTVVQSSAQTSSSLPSSTTQANSSPYPASTTGSAIAAVASSAKAGIANIISSVSAFASNTRESIAQRYQHHSPHQSQQYQDSNVNNSQWVSTLSEMDVQKLLIDGQVFMKYKHGRSRRRNIWSPPEMDRIYWGSDDKTLAKGFILIEDITSVSEGCRGAKKPNYAFTIHTSERDLELEAPNVSVKTRWMEAVRFLIKVIQQGQ